MWKTLIPPLLLSLLSSTLGFAEQVSQPVPRLLYFTQGGDPWHDYQWQAEKFKSTLPQWLEVEIETVGVEDKKQALKTLQDPNFAKGYDLLIYNACFAYSSDFYAIANIRRQARELGVPVVLLHCAMHNFRSTSPSLGALGQVLTAWDKWKWKESDMRPIWSDFTGIDSLLHEPSAAITLTKALEHPITNGLPEQLTLEKDELYIALSQSQDLQTLYFGVTSKKSPQPVAWIHPQPGAEVVGITLGHDQSTWNSDFYWQLLANTVNYLTKNGE